MELRTVLNKGSNENKHCIHADFNRLVDIFIMFDEAHTLANCYDDHKESRCAVLRRALSGLTNVPLFSFFLSTTAKVIMPRKPHHYRSSDRIYLSYLATPRPYVYLGFDQLAHNHKVKLGDSLDYLTSLDFIAHLGRPL